MRESKFVEQNKEKWKELENELKTRNIDPQFLRSKMIQITDDLSYSRTFYKNRSVRIYLNGLAQQLYNKIYKNRRNFISTVKKFYLEEIPRIVYHGRKEMLIAFLLLVFCTLIGAFSTAKDPGFASSILSESYVQTTKDNISKGDPFGVYKDSDSISMFIYIAMNNLKVSLLVFIFGLFASYGALAMMVHNGIMLGTFMYFFYSRGLATEFNLTVWMHGSIEILTLVIETTAGMLLGRGLIYPGTLSRTKAFSVWGRRGAMLFLSTIPFILLAAFIESFLTRHTELPNAIRAVFIIVSVGMMLIYFVIYPLWKFRSQKDTDLGMPELSAETEIEFKKEMIYGSGSLFLMSIQIIGKKFSSHLRFMIVSAILFVLAILAYDSKKFVVEMNLVSKHRDNVFDLVTQGVGSGMNNVFGQLGIVFNKWESLPVFLISTLWLGSILFFTLRMLGKYIQSIDKLNRLKMLFLPFLISAVINGICLLSPGSGIFYILLIAPFTVFLTDWLFGIEQGQRPEFYIFRGGFLSYLGIALVSFALMMLCMIFLVTPLFFVIQMLLEINVNFTPEMFNTVTQAFSFFLLILLISIILSVTILYSALLTFTLREIRYANGLKSSILEIGKTKKAYGIETE